MISTTLEQKLIIDLADAANDFDLLFGEHDGLKFSEQSPTHKKLYEAIEKLKAYAAMFKAANTVSLSGINIIDSVKRAERAFNKTD